jgi:hypothetical protein
MIPDNKTASLAGLAGSVVKIAVAAPSYRNCSEIATPEYAAVKVATRFRLRIETARLVCHLSGLGGGQ